MTNKNIDRHAVYFDNNTQLYQKDAETQSSFWAVKSNHIKFTYFDVPPKAVFARHSHKSEQVTYVLDGCLFFRLNHAVFSLRSGDSIIIPPHCEHEVYSESEGARAVDAWYSINSSCL